MQTAHQLAQRNDQPNDDGLVWLRGVSWADYLRLLKVRGDHSAPRIAYVEGTVEIMRPSQPHEAIKGLIGRLVEQWCMHHDLPFSTFGSWTIKRRREQRGVEPDECYVFSDVARPTRPDLAIEVIWTSGGLDKLDIYNHLGVPEVWIWRRGAITPWVLVGQDYVAATDSRCLPGFDFALAASLVDRRTSEAIKAFRVALERRTGA